VKSRVEPDVLAWQLCRLAAQAVAAIAAGPCGALAAEEDGQTPTQFDEGEEKFWRETERGVVVSWRETWPPPCVARGTTWPLVGFTSR
jgi:hypothetical protein